MSQSRRHSLLESWVNIAIGYIVNLFGQLFIFPLLGIHIPIHTNLVIGAFFTVISLIRSYSIRRWFNAR